MRRLDGENKEAKTQTEKQERETERKEWIYRVEIVWQPFVWVSFSAVCISVFSLILVWKQVGAIRQSGRAWLIITPKCWSPDLLESVPTEGKYPANIFGAAIKNCGKTPAHVLEAALHYFLLDRNEFDSLSNEPKFQFISREGLLLVPQDSFGEDVLLNSKNRVARHE